MSGVARVLLAVGVAFFLHAAAWADEAHLVGNASFAPGNTGHLGATPTINVGGPTENFRAATADLSGKSGLRARGLRAPAPVAAPGAARKATASASGRNRRG